MNCTAPVIANPFQQTNISDSTELILSVFNEKKKKLTRTWDYSFANSPVCENNSEWHKSLQFRATGTVSYSKTSVNWGECMFWFYLFKSIRVFGVKQIQPSANVTQLINTYLNWSELGFSIMKTLKLKYRSSSTDKHLNDYMWMAINKQSLNKPVS